MKIAYMSKHFNAKSMVIIQQANSIIREYSNQGFILTLRQLYYQFVSRDLLKNNLKSYTNLGNIINDARMCGLIDWEAIEDRTRNLQKLSHWRSPSQIMDTAIYSYRLNKWEKQLFRPEVWIEKEALVGVIQGVCDKWDVPYFACRGYNSQSEQWRAGQRLLKHISNSKIPIIIHLGDHDPSGIDMTRDNIDRLSLFTHSNIEVRRLALNFDQVTKYNPPPNPAKATDSRFNSYADMYGEDCWELDALEPSVIVNLIEDEIKSLIDFDAWESVIGKENDDKQALIKAKKMLRK